MDFRGRRRLWIESGRPRSDRAWIPAPERRRALDPRYALPRGPIGLGDGRRPRCLRRCRSISAASCLALDAGRTRGRCPHDPIQPGATDMNTTNGLERDLARWMEDV